MAMLTRYMLEGYELQEVGDFQVELYKETPLQLSVTKIKEEIPMIPLEPSKPVEKPEIPDKEDNKKEGKKNSPKTGNETNAAAAALTADVSLAVLVKKSNNLKNASHFWQYFFEIFRLY